MCSTVFEQELEKHKSKCNARPLPAKPYFSSRINVHGSSLPAFADGDALATEPALVRGMEPEDYRGLALKVLDTCHKLGLATQLQKLAGETGDTLTETLTETLTDTLTGTLKETYQQDAICDRVMRECQAFRSFERTAVLEMGCGKAGLSHHLISKNAARLAGATFYLVDRDNFKRKKDVHALNAGNPGDEESGGVRVERIRIDIQDLDLDRLLAPDTEQVLVVSKHLCGAATCLSLVALRNLLARRPRLRVRVIVALCCHHRCDAGMFCWRDLLGSGDGFSEPEFRQLCGMSSWAVCGWKYGAKEQQQHGAKEQRQHGAKEQRQHYSGYTYEECVRIGLACKALLNHGRRQFLESLGFAASVEAFVPTQVTLENQLLLASYGH